jgi:hypothetical protein
MANDAAWQAGWNIGAERAREGRERKQARADQLYGMNLLDKYNEVKSQRENAVANLSAIEQDPKFGKNSPEYKQALETLTQINQAHDNLLNPQKNPGALRKIAEMLKIAPGAKTPAAAARVTQTTEPGLPAATMAGMPAAPGEEITFPTAMAGGGAYAVKGPKAGQEVKVEPHATQVPGQEEVPISAAAQPAYRQAELGRAPYPGEYKPGTPQELRERAQRRQTAEAEAGRQAATLPLSPAQQAVQAAHAQSAGVLAGLQDMLDAVPKFFTPEEAPEARKDVLQKQFGTAASGTGKWDQVTGKVDGTPTTLLYNVKTGKYKTRTGEDVPDEVLNKFIADPKAAKPSTSKFGVNVDSYKAMHGIPPDQMLTPQELNFVEQQIALSSSAPSTTITNTLKQDANGFWVPIQEANRRIPGFGVILPDPRGRAQEPKAGAPAAGAPAGKPAAVPKTPGEAKKTAQARATGGAAPAAPAKPAGGASVRVGAPLFAAPNKDYTETKTAYQSAIDRTKVMDKNLASALKGDQQAMLSLVANHIGMTLGAQKGARINQAVWNEAVESAHLDERMIAKSFHQDANGDYIFDGWKTGVTLTPAQMHQMVNLAHERTEILKEHLDRLKTELKLDGGAGAAAGGGAWKPPTGAPPAANYPEGHELYNKRTKTVDAVVRGGQWANPQQ